jgi:uncharacterized protein involved in exopolysaccharide biosynthesis
MKPPETVQFRPDSVNLLNLIIKYRIALIITAVIAALISAGISLTITPMYRSVVVLYPTTNVVETPTLLGVQSTATGLFGDETATEKVLQILRSDNIKDHLVRKYKLMDHYGISQKEKFKYTILDGRMKKNIVSRKTEYNSIEVSVLDADPVVASTIANDIARQIDTVFNQIVKDAGRRSYNAILNSYNEQLRRVKSLEDSLVVVSPKDRVSVYPGNLRAGMAGSSWGTASGQYSPEFLRLINMFESENENLSDIRGRLTEAKMLAEQDLPYTHIINMARVSEKKVLPKRSFIVAASTLSTLLLMIFLLGLSESVVRNGK